MTLVGIYGASGFGREVMPLTASPKLDIYEHVFIDDDPIADTLNGYRVLSFENFVEQGGKNAFVSIAVADSGVRQVLADKCRRHSLNILSIVAPTSLVMDEVDIGEGSIICPFVTITSNVKIGRFFHANLYSYVAHDCVVGDFVTFAPNVHCNGNVKIEDHAYIGTGAIIRQGQNGEPLVIGEGATVGMGAVVTRSVPPGVTVVGNPAKIFNKV